jgi:putative ABC transport system permease protein
MLLNYFKIALRNLFKNKLHTIINVAGLALGIASVFLITIYVRYELNYDRYYNEHENLYRITWENENPQTRTPHPMAQALVADFPEVESAVSLSPLWAAGLTREIFSVRNIEKNIRFDESNVLSVDTTFFDVFRFPVVRGDAKKALKNVNGILLSESMVKKYFGDENPIGKHLSVNDDTVLLEVMAVFKDVPDQSHFHFDFLVSYVREKSFDPDDEYYTWADFGHFNYLRLKPGTDPLALQGKLMTWIRKYIDVSDEDFQAYAKNNLGFRVQPVTDIHLKSHLRWELEPNGNIEYVYIMAAAALLTLVIACINFMNLMTAKSTERAKEIGIRKTLGALRSQLSAQFLSESIVIALMSVFIALFLVEVSLPFFNILTGQQYEMNYWQVLPMLVGIGTIIGIGSGIYPALMLSSVNAHTILKGKFQTSSRGNGLRNALIVFQFAISMTLISGAVIIFNQLQFIQQKSLGFEKEEVLVIPLKNEAVMPRIQALKTELMRMDGVSSVSASSNLPGGQFNQNSISLVENPAIEISCSEAFVDYDFLKTLNIQLSDGKFFSVENLNDSAALFVLNETAARQLHGSSVVGKELHWHAYENDRAITGRIIGIMKDFHFQSFHEPVRPIMFVLYPNYNHLVIKMTTTNLDNKLAQVKRVFAQFDNTFEFEFSFLDDRLNKQYEAEERTGIIFTSFAFIAIIIACFGLFGMAMLSFTQRIKEISIRKVLGATVSGLIVLLLKDFTKLIFIAIVIATPFAWWIMDRWLDNFMYQVGIRPTVFIASGVALLAIAWITLSYFTLKTSRVNPAETLKNE